MSEKKKKTVFTLKEISSIQVTIHSPTKNTNVTHGLEIMNSHFHTCSIAGRGSGGEGEGGALCFEGENSADNEFTVVMVNSTFVGNHLALGGNAGSSRVFGGAASFSMYGSNDWSLPLRYYFYLSCSLSLSLALSLSSTSDIDSLFLPFLLIT